MANEQFEIRFKIINMLGVEKGIQQPLLNNCIYILQHTTIHYL